MSAKIETGDEGGLQGPSESVVNGATAILRVAGHLAQTAVGVDGKLVPSAVVQLALRHPAGRRELLEQVVAEVAPNRVDLHIWETWLKGGYSPFEVKLRKPKAGHEGPSRILARSNPRVASLEAKVARTRAKLEQEEDELAASKALDNAAVHWMVVDQLSDIVSPVFAMGPAWTLMRSVSAFISEERLDHETDVLFGQEKENAIDSIRAEREQETAKLLAALDAGGGNEDFENDLRRAMLKVVEVWEKKPKGLAEGGRKSRAFKEVQTRVAAVARMNSEGVLDGLKRAD